MERLRFLPQPLVRPHGKDSPPGGKGLKRESRRNSMTNSSIQFKLCTEKKAFAYFGRS